MEDNLLFDIANRFQIKGTPKKIKKLKGGHINETYKLECMQSNQEIVQYILQKVNTQVFPNIEAVMLNMKKVTAYIKENSDSVTAGVIETCDNSKTSLYDGCWRMTEYIPDTVSFETTNDINILKEAGRAVGHFQKLLNGFNINELSETIIKFHDTRYRFNNFICAIKNKENMSKRLERYKLAEKEIEFVLDHKNIINSIMTKLEQGIIPFRVTHNDTKLSNILFEKNRPKAVCLIDFDTVMPGSLLFDYGEGIRTSCTTAKEDEEDLCKVIWEELRFEAFTNRLFGTSN